MSRVVEILMRRDGNTLREAEERVRDVRQMMADCEYDIDEVDEILMDELGLEPDYLFDLI